MGSVSPGNWGSTWSTLVRTPSPCTRRAPTSSSHPRSRRSPVRTSGGTSCCSWGCSSDSRASPSSSSGLSSAHEVGGGSPPSLEGPGALRRAGAGIRVRPGARDSPVGRRRDSPVGRRRDSPVGRRPQAAPLDGLPRLPPAGSRHRSPSRHRWCSHRRPCRSHRKDSQPRGRSRRRPMTSRRIRRAASPLVGPARAASPRPVRLRADGCGLPTISPPGDAARPL
jgi:hypothetical protein